MGVIIWDTTERWVTRLNGLNEYVDKNKRNGYLDPISQCKTRQKVHYGYILCEKKINNHQNNLKSNECENTKFSKSGENYTYFQNSGLKVSTKFCSYIYLNSANELDTHTENENYTIDYGVIEITWDFFRFHRPLNHHSILKPNMNITF